MNQYQQAQYPPPGSPPPQYPPMAQMRGNPYQQPYGPQGQGAYYGGMQPQQGMSYAPQPPAPVYVEQQRGGDGCCAGFLAALCCCCCMDAIL